MTVFGMLEFLKTYFHPKIHPPFFFASPISSNLMIIHGYSWGLMMVNYYIMVISGDLWSTGPNFYAAMAGYAEPPSEPPSFDWSMLEVLSGGVDTFKRYQ